MPPFTDIHGGPALPGKKGRGGKGLEWGSEVGTGGRAWEGRMWGRLRAGCKINR